MSAPRPLRAAALLALVICLVGAILAAVPQTASAKPSALGVRATADQLATAPQPAKAVASVARASEAAQRTSFAVAAAADPVGCGYGQGGQYDDTICWLDMAGYDDAQAKTEAGQDMTVTLPGGYTLRYNIKTTVVPGRTLRAVTAVTTPIETRFAFGSEAYRSIPGRPSLYSAAGANTGLDVTLSGIRLEDSSGNPVTSFSFVATDTEDNVAAAAESLRWTSDKPLNLLETLYPTTTKGCIPANITGLGTTEVNCVGAGTASTFNAKSTSILVSADAPSTFALRWLTGARSGIAFGINTASVQVTKVVQGRAASTDSFDVSITSPEGSTLATASTGNADTATTGRVVVIPPTNGGSFTLTDVVTPGSGTDMGDYDRSWSCTRNGQPDPSLPSGSGASVQVSPAANESIACTVTNTAILDYGDAPSSYGTRTADDAARHRVAGPTLGATRDNEADGQPTTAADGDDSNGTDDEDGVAFNTDVSIPGRLESVFVTASASGFLNAWIDYDGDGAFESGERIAEDVSVSAGANRIIHTVPADAVPGSTFARFRLTSGAGQALSPTGPSPNGEVEDYARTIFDAEQAALDECPAGSTPFPLSFIQNPSFEERTTPSFVNGSANTINFAEYWYDSHPTGGQYHVFEPTPGFNSGPNEATMPFRAGADGHGFLGGHSSGSLGEGATNTLATPLVAGVTYVGFFSIGAGGYLRNDSGYMRFFGVSDREVGSIDHPSVTDPSATNSESLGDTITVAPAPAGQRPQWKVATFALTPSKDWDYLRVEARDAVPGGSTGNQAWMSFDDFHLFSCQSTSDFGDAPSTYGTATGSNPAFHVVSGHDGNGNTAPLMLGSSVDLDSDGAPGPAADGDDTSGADDEDGVSGPITARAGDDTAVRVTATNNTTTAATLAGWIDANGDGTFETDERQTVAVPASSGTADHTLTFPEPTAAGDTYARFRLFAGDVTDPDPIGSAVGGEVEDYAVTSEFVSDFGDAPASYGTTLAENGPRHTIAGYDAQNRTARLSLGSAIDDEADGLVTTTADGDDGATVDDEDAVADPITATTGQPSTVTVSVKNSRNRPATLAGWFDLDRDGTFEAGERVTAPVPADAGSVTRQLTFPAATVEGVTYARFRVFPGDVADPLPTGAATAGEVEDHPATITQAGPVVTCNTDPAIFNTAYDGNGGEIAPGSRDANWQAGLGNATGPASVTDWIPAWATNRASGWALSRFGNADWISYYADTGHSGNVDVYFRYRFRIAPEVSLDAFAMPMNFYADNSVPEVWVNGVAQSAFHAGRLPQSANTYQYAGFSEGNRARIVLSDSFQHGPNTVVVRVASGQPNMGLMAQVGPSPLCADAGDAPASYGTAKSENGAAHGLEGYDDAAHTADLMLGDLVDADADGVPSFAADSDDSTRTDDEDALVAVSLAAGATSVSLDVPVTNDTGGAATLHGWIDANGNGVFQTGERAAASVPAGASSATLAWTGLTALADGSRPSLRLRLTTDTLTDNAATAAVDERAVGAASDGEVEDHQAVVGSALPSGCTTPFVEDFGTGPNYGGPLPTGQTTYVWRSGGTVTDGSYTLISALAPVSAGAGGIGGWWHTGPDHTPGDTDGRMMVVNATAGQTDQFFQRTFRGLHPGAIYDFAAWVTNAGTGGNIRPNVKFRVVDARTGALLAETDSGNLPFTTAAQGMAWRRVALQFSAPTSDVRLEIQNNAPGGSGNDLALDDIGFNLACDWGDAPVAYRTLAEDDGPVHAIAGPRLGLERDGEGNGLPTPGADGDDTSATDDEDAVAGPVEMTVGETTTVEVSATGDGGAATLAGWLDVDGDGAFEAGERVVVPVAAGTDTYELTFPAGTPAGGSTYARFRVFPGTVADPSPTGPAPGGEVEDHRVTVLRPGLDVEKTSDATPDTRPGDVVNYTVTLTNTGDGAFTAANPARMVDDLGGVLDDADYNADAEATVGGTAVAAPTYDAPRIRWQGPLASGATVEITYSVTVKGGGDGTARNVAWVPDGPTPGPKPDCDDPAVTVPCDGSEFLLPKLTVSKSASRNDLPGVGEQITYTVTVRNTGPGTWSAEEPGLADDLSDVEDDAVMVGDPTATSGTATYDATDAELTWSGALAATESVTISYTFEYDGAGDQSLVNSACVPMDSALVPEDNCRTTTTPGSGLDQAKTSSPASGTAVDAGDEITYTLRFTNTGQTAASVDTTDDLSDVLDDATLTEGPTADPGLTATLVGDTLEIDGSVPVGETLLVTYTVTVEAWADQGDHLLRNELACESGDAAACDPGVVEHPARRLVVDKSVAQAPADPRPGDKVTYTVTATNPGPGDYTADQPAVVVDDLSDVLDDGTLDDGATATIGGSPVADPTSVGQLLSWSGALAAGETVTITYTITLQGGGDGTVHNTAFVPDCDPGASDCDPTPPDCVRGSDPTTGLSCDSEELLLPKLTIAKEAGPTQVNAVGAVVTYTVAVTNEGPGDYTAGAPASFVDDLSDVLDDATYVTDSETADAGSASYTEPELSWTGALAAGEVATVTYQVRYNGADDQSMVNAACVPEDEAEVPDEACDSVTVEGSALTQTKTANPDNGTAVDVGDDIVYTLTFTNDGNVPATVNTTDDLSGVLDDAALIAGPTAQDGLAVTRTGDVLAITGAVPAGETRTVTYTVEVGQLDDQGDHLLKNTLACQPGEPPTCEPETTEHPVRGLRLTKSTDATVHTRPGETVLYTVTAENVGSGDYTAADPAVVLDDLRDVLDDAIFDVADVEVTRGSVDYAAPELTWTGALPAGETVTITYSVVVTNHGDHDLVNTVSNERCTGDATACPPRGTETLLPHVVPDKAADPVSGTVLAAGDLVTYTLTWTNDGKADGVVDATDDLSGVLDDADLVAGPTSSSLAVNATVTGEELRVTGPIAMGETVTVTYQVRVRADGERTDDTMENVLTPDAPQVECSNGVCEPVEPPGTSHLIGALDDWKTADPARGRKVTAGQRITYTLHFTNTGTGPVDVDRDDVLLGVLDDAALVAAPVASDPALDVSKVVNGRFTVTGVLAPDQTVTVSYRVRVKPSSRQGDRSLDNFLVDPGQQPPRSCNVPRSRRAQAGRADCTSHEVRRFDLTVNKRALTRGRIGVGETVRYGIVVANKGPDASGDRIKVVDRLPRGLDLRTVRGKGWDCSVSGNTATCVRTKALPTGRKAPRIVVAAVVEPSAAGDRVVNTAKVSGAGEGRDANNDDRAVINVAEIPPLPDGGYRQLLPWRPFG